MTKALTTSKFVTAGHLAAILARRRLKGDTVVFTNGCFDLVHAGHVAVLEKSRALGDCLVVGLNSDASMRGLKGPGRPLVDQRNRARLLGAMACVDYVVVFNDPTPAALIKRLKPDILVKGGDYKVEDIVGREDVKKVVRIPLVKGLSTTALIGKIIKAYGR
jgi:rfaE bifunctional protein nucleotidyltransferase chain/domain